MRRMMPLILLIVLLLLAVVPAGLRYVNFYGFGRAAERPAAPVYTAANIPNVVPPSQGAFVDEPTVGSGRVLLDMSHGNNFTMPEIASLNGRLSARGYQLLPYRSGNLARQLRGVSAFVVITPLETFAEEEVLAVVEFVERGGRLLLIGDPARFQVGYIEDDFGFILDYFIESDALPLNNLAHEFDITFEGDYLYNLEESEGNFRNILMGQSEMEAENELTAELDSIAFYGSHSVKVGATATPLLMGGSQTYSSATDRAGGLVLGAMGSDGRVLALGDINFLTEPYYASLDNTQFIARIADFLVQGEREYVLTDFPYFYDSGQIELVYVGEVDLGADAFDEIISLQDAFKRARQELRLTAAPENGDTLYVGLYNQALQDPAIVAMLEEAGITLLIDPPVLTEEELEALAEEEEATTEEEVEEEAEEEAVEEETAAEDETTSPEGEEEEPVDEPEITQQIQSDMGNVQMLGTAILLYRETDDGRELLLLAPSKEGLENSIGRLLDLLPLDSEYALADCLTTESMAICPTNVEDEVVEAELLTGGVPAGPEEEVVEEESEEPVIEEEEDVEEETESFEFTLDDLDPPPVEQGEIALDESATGTLGEGETHVWTYSGDSGTVNISLIGGGEEFDAVIEVYDADGIFVQYEDSTFGGEEELLENLDIDTGYFIVVQEFFAVGGDYTLTVTAGEGGVSEGEVEEGEETAETSPIETIFLYVDDDGDFLGETAADSVDLAALLEDDYEVVVWSASEATSELTEEDLVGYDLIIWYSGLYRSESSFDGDSLVLTSVLLEGGNLFIIGATPPLFEPAEISPLADVELVGEDEVLLAGWETGDVLELTAAYETTIVDPTDLDTETDTLFAVRGPSSPNSGDVVGVSVRNEEEGSNILVLLLPFEALETAEQEQFLLNGINWFATG